MPELPEVEIIVNDLRSELVGRKLQDVQKRSEELLAKMLEISKEMVAVADHNTRVAPVSPLSEQEQRILRLFAKAKNPSETARDLGITLPTLRNHRHSINEKQRTHNRLEAVMHAMQRGLI